MLITLADIRKTREVSGSLKEARINQYIRDAELSDLRPLLGEQIYQDIVLDPTETARGSYPDLLDGSVYTYGSYDYTHPGLKEVLVDFTYARYRFFGSDIDTPFSTVVKGSRNSEPTGFSRNREIYTAIRKVAHAKWELEREYLNRMAGEDVGTAYEYWFNQRPPLDNDEDEININKITIR